MAEPERCPYQDLSDVEIKALNGEDLQRIGARCWQCVKLQVCRPGREILAAVALGVAAVKMRTQ